MSSKRSQPGRKSRDAVLNEAKPKPKDYLLSKMLDKEETDEIPESVIEDPIANFVLGMQSQGKDD